MSSVPLLWGRWGGGGGGGRLFLLQLPSPQPPGQRAKPPNLERVDVLFISNMNAQIFERVQNHMKMILCSKGKFNSNSLHLYSTEGNQDFQHYV